MHTQTHASMQRSVGSKTPIQIKLNYNNTNNDHKLLKDVINYS